MISIGDILKGIGKTGAGFVGGIGKELLQSQNLNTSLSSDASSAQATAPKVPERSPIADTRPDRDAEKSVKEPILDTAEFKFTKIKGTNIVKALDQIHAGIVGYLNTVNQNTSKTFNYVRDVAKRHDARINSLAKDVGDLRKGYRAIEQRLFKIDYQLKNLEARGKKSNLFPETTPSMSIGQVGGGGLLGGVGSHAAAGAVGGATGGLLGGMFAGVLPSMISGGASTMPLAGAWWLKQQMGGQAGYDKWSGQQWDKIFKDDPAKAEQYKSMTPFGRMTESWKDLGKDVWSSIPKPSMSISGAARGVGSSILKAAPLTAPLYWGGKALGAMTGSAKAAEGGDDADAITKPDARAATESLEIKRANINLEATSDISMKARKISLSATTIELDATSISIKGEVTGQEGGIGLRGGGGGRSQGQNASPMSLSQVRGAVGGGQGNDSLSPIKMDDVRRSLGMPMGPNVAPGGFTPGGGSFSGRAGASGSDSGGGLLSMLGGLDISKIGAMAAPLLGGGNMGSMLKGVGGMLGGGGLGGLLGGGSQGGSTGSWGPGSTTTGPQIPGGATSPTTTEPGGLHGLREQRQRFAEEINSNPALKAKIFGIMMGENPNPNGNLAVLESAMNRASMMGTSLAHEMRTTAEGGYYAGYKPGDVAGNMQLLETSLGKALGGSNISNFATENASGSWGAARMSGKLFAKVYGDTDRKGYSGGEIFGIPVGPGARGFDRYQRWKAGVIAASQQEPQQQQASGQPQQQQPTPPGQQQPLVRPIVPSDKPTVLQKIPGMNPVFARDGGQVDPRLMEILSAAQKHMPEGYSVGVTSAIRAGREYRGPHGFGEKSALDVQIKTPGGEYLSNRGTDTTGLYQRFAQGAYGEMLARYPELKGRFTWGGQFETSAGSGQPDLMHFDLMGNRGHFQQYNIDRLGPLPGVQYGQNKVPGQQTQLVQEGWKYSHTGPGETINTPIGPIQTGPYMSGDKQIPDMMGARNKTLEGFKAKLMTIDPTGNLAARFQNSQAAREIERTGRVDMNSLMTEMKLSDDEFKRIAAAMPGLQREPLYKNVPVSGKTQQTTQPGWNPDTLYDYGKQGSKDKGFQYGNLRYQDPKDLGLNFTPDQLKEVQAARTGAQTDTDRQYGEQGMDFSKAGGQHYIRAQIENAKKQGIPLELDNADAVSKKDLHAIYAQANAAGVRVLLKNPKAEDLKEFGKYAVGAIFEHGAMSPKEFEAARKAAGMPNFPGTFVRMAGQGDIDKITNEANNIPGTSVQLGDAATKDAEYMNMRRIGGKAGPVQTQVGTTQQYVDISQVAATAAGELGTAPRRPTLSGPAVPPTPHGIAKIGAAIYGKIFEQPNVVKQMPYPPSTPDPMATAFKRGGWDEDRAIVSQAAIDAARAKDQYAQTQAATNAAVMAQRNALPADSDVTATGDNRSVLGMGWDWVKNKVSGESALPQPDAVPLPPPRPDPVIGDEAPTDATTEAASWAARESQNVPDAYPIEDRAKASDVSLEPEASGGASVEPPPQAPERPSTPTEPPGNSQPGVPLQSPVHNPENERAKPGDNGYGTGRRDPDGLGLCTI